ncbi:hypothetical protein Vadar_019071 [Vaccinium darrowii]|uniref:Uncharacterized protein n=1 Tax=Vaccinium darrowii TaxID=229202 RepID=A0ACB7Y8A4_9ERIC|nr:hypothetical protein Vadar_019071 [Vaccinium darrowii]
MVYSSKRKSLYHIRSISLPSRSHPTTFRIEEKLHKLKKWEASATTTTAEEICNGLLGLNELYKCLDELLNLPLTQKSLSLRQHKGWIDESLDISVTLLDVCSITRDFTSQVKEHVKDLLSTIRRKKGDSKIQNSVAKYVRFRKEMKKVAKKLNANVKQIDNRIPSLPLIEELDNRHALALIRVLREVSSINISVYNLVLLFLSEPISKPNSKTWSKLLDQCREAFEEQEDNRNELQRVDVALNNMWKCGGSSELREKMKIAQNGLEQLESSMESFESSLECLFKGLIKARTSLLNIVSL